METQEWREGPAVPFYVGKDAYAQLGEANTFLVFYAYEGDMAILMFDRVNYCWSVVREAPAGRDYGFALIELPQDLGACDENNV